MDFKYHTWTKGERTHAMEWLRAGDILSTPDRYSLRPTQTTYATMSLGSLDVPPNHNTVTTRTWPIPSYHGHSGSLAPEPPDSLQVPQGRTRSNTAPSTPWCTAGSPLLAELPGSMPAPYDIDNMLTIVPSLGMQAYATHSAVQDRPVRTIGYTGPEVESSYTKAEFMLQGDLESTLLQQISSLRATHEAHLISLKNTHEKEMASHLSYIAFLERRQSISHATTPLLLTPYDQRSATTLSIDTPFTYAPMYELPAPATSSSGRQTSGSSWASARKSPHDSAIAVESSKEQLSLAKKAKIDSSRMSGTSVQAQDALTYRDEDIKQLEQQLQRVKKERKSLRTTICTLQAQLSAANNERVDVLEGYHEACRLLKQTRARHSSSPAVHRRRIDFNVALSPKTSTMVAIDDPQVDANHFAQPLTQEMTRHVAELESQLQQAEQKIQEQDTRLVQLRGSQCVRKDSEAHNSARFFELQAQLEKQELYLKQAEDDRDKYKSLLEKELRRQSRQATRQARAVSQSVDTQTSVRLKGIIADAKFKADLQHDHGYNGQDPRENSTYAELLEQQVELALRDAIEYKLEARSLKRALKNADIDLCTLQAITTPRPPTPEMESREHNYPTTPNSRPQAQYHDLSPGGLSIAIMPTPQPTPSPKPRSRIIGTASTRSPHVLTSPSVVDVKRTVRHVKSVSNAQKDLPRPPKSPSTPTLGQKSPHAAVVHRSDTPRSISDSIITSYMQRATPDQQQEAFSPVHCSPLTHQVGALKG